MKVSRSSTLDAPVEDVFPLIVSEEHQQAKVATAQGRAGATVEERADGCVEVNTERTLSTRGMPASVSSLVGETLMVAERQIWHPAGPDGTRRADLSIDVKGAPVTLQGEVTLAPAQDGSRLLVDADLTCSVPFIGRKIEAAALPTIEESFDLEIQLLRERLR